MRGYKLAHAKANINTISVCSIKKSGNNHDKQKITKQGR